MNAEQWSAELILRYGQPKSAAHYKALLEYTFSAGQKEGADKAGKTMMNAFRSLDTKVPA